MVLKSQPNSFLNKKYKEKNIASRVSDFYYGKYSKSEKPSNNKFANNIFWSNNFWCLIDLKKA